MRTIALAVLLACALPTTADDGAPTASARLRAALDAIQAFNDREDPVQAIQRGRPADAGRIRDESLAAIERRNEEAKRQLAMLRAIDHAALTETERLDAELIERDLQMGIEGFAFGGHLLVVGPLGGPQQWVPQMTEQMPFGRADDLRAHLSRLKLVPGALAEQQALLAEGLRRGITPPRAILPGVVPQFDAVMGGKLQPLREPFARTYADLDPAEAA